MKILLSLIFLELLTSRSIANDILDRVPVRSPELFPLIFSIIDLVDDIDENVEIIPAVQVICKTVGGPNPGRDCVFPFKWNGKVHNGCPIDSNDKTKRWCSTKVDSNGNHVPSQNEYGYCGAFCPAHNDAPAPGPTTVITLPTPCTAGEKCRSFTACAAQNSLKDGKNCRQNDGSRGMCCKSINKNVNSNSILGLSTRQGDIPSVGQNIRGIVTKNSVTRAINFGESFARNVSVAANKIGGKLFDKGSPEFFHAQFQKPKLKVNSLADTALISAFVARTLLQDQNNHFSTRGADNDFLRYGFTNADISNSALSKQCPPQPRCSSRYRTFDGSCNNKRNPKYGQALTPLQRILPNAYADQILTPRRARNRGPLPSARLVSTTVFTKDAKNPSRVNTALLMSMGQFIDHDITHVPMRSANGQPIDCCSNGKNPFDLTFDPDTVAVCFPIQIPINDAFYKGKKTCMNFARSETAPDMDCQPGPLQQVNQISHWLDGSNIYGSSREEARKLRKYRGGLLKTTKAGSGNGELLPRDKEKESGPGCPGGRTDRCFLAGDDRVNEQPTLAVMHTLFLREHNRVARKLSQINPRWNDEKLYLESRRIVTAEWQHVVYNEWLPIMLGQQYMTRYGIYPLTDGFSDSYRSDFDPRITNAFAAAAFRVGHTLIPGVIEAYNRRGQKTKSQKMKRSFGDMDLLQQSNNVEKLLRGMIRQPAEKADSNFVDDVKNHLFVQEQSDQIGLDLMAINIQRGRDHGIPGYVEYRRICQVGKANSFNDLTSNISPQRVNLLKQVYKSVEDIDLYVGMTLERPSQNGALVGDTFLCLIGDQFARLKWGDRYFYDLRNQPGSFNLNQLNEIRKTSLARLICDNTEGIAEVQPLALEMPDAKRNPKIFCDSGLLFLGIPNVDLSQWRT